MNATIGAFPVSARGWASLVDRHRADSKSDEAGIGSRIWNGDTGLLYFPMVDFLPGLKFGSKHIDLFWKALEAEFPKQRFYLFYSGNAHHGLLNTLFDARQEPAWKAFLLRHPHVVDIKWVNFAKANDNRGVLRTTIGKHRPVPRIHWWVNT